jgi:hypothetical protein
LIAHRCPEIDDADLAEPVDALPVEIGDLILDAIDEVQDRLDRLAEAVGHGGDDDDDADQ